MLVLSAKQHKLVITNRAFMRKSIFLAAEAWRQHYGQLATGKNDTPVANLDFQLPSTGETITLPGWRTEVRQGDTGDYTVYINPEGVFR